MQVFQRLEQLAKACLVNKSDPLCSRGVTQVVLWPRHAEAIKQDEIPGDGLSVREPGEGDPSGVPVPETQVSGSIHISAPPEVKEHINNGLSFLLKHRFCHCFC